MHRYSITSSARVSSVAGTSSPNALGSVFGSDDCFGHTLHTSDRKVWRHCCLSDPSRTTPSIRTSRFRKPQVHDHLVAHAHLGLAGAPAVMTETMERRLLDAAANAGLVDGNTGKCEPTVDGLPVEVHVGIVELLAATAQRGIRYIRPTSSVG